jgi:hypothetical protein
MEISDMSQQVLKIGPLPNKKPTKISVALEPDLQADLQDYAAVYARTYGSDVSVTALIPSMLRALLDSDTGFRRARKQLGNGSATHQ